MSGNANPLGRVFDIVEGWPPVDLQSGANTGDWVSLANANGVLCLFGSGVGTAGDDPTITVNEATTNTGTGSQALNIAAPMELWTKQAATSLASTTSWTDSTASASTNTYTSATAAEQDALWALWIPAEALDVADGYDHINVTVADIGANAQPGFLLYIVIPKYGADPSAVVSFL